jgi:aarF domain-containing kinase
VAVKVQHKWIKEQVPGDIRLIDIAVDIGQRFFPEFKYKWLPEEMAERMPLELDFTLEAKNAENCKEIFKNNPNIAVPSIYHQFTRQRVLTMSYEQGIPLTRVQEMHEKGVDLKRTAKIISEAFNFMIFEKGVVHADPHPGNMFVRTKTLSNGKEDIEVVLLDHGIYTYLNDDVRLSYNKLWRGILTQNEDKIKEASIELGTDFY